jgi:hypothetical protein
MTGCSSPVFHDKPLSWRSRAIFSGQVFILKGQFLVDQTSDVGQQADPAILFHAEGPYSLDSTPRIF